MRTTPRMLPPPGNAARILPRIALGAAALLLMAGCSNAPQGGTPADGKSNFPSSGSGVVNVFNMTNFLSPDAIAKFTEDTGIEVTVDAASSTEEMTAKIKTGSATYDVTLVTDHQAEDLIKGGHLAEINVLDWPNAKHIEEEAKQVFSDPGRKYTSPYAQVIYGLGVNPESVTEPIARWKDYFAAPASAVGNIGLHDSQTFVIDAALLAVGAKSCTQDKQAYQAALELLQGFKPSVKIISSDGTIDRLASGETTLSTMWNGSFARAQAQDPNLKYVYPEEGYMFSSDSWAQLTNAQNPENALIFMNWMLEPENAALAADFIKYTSPIIGIEEYLSADASGNSGVLIPNEEEAKRGNRMKQCEPEQQEQYDKLWTMFKG